MYVCMYVCMYVTLFTLAVVKCRITTSNKEIPKLLGAPFYRDSLRVTIVLGSGEEVII